MNQAVEAYRGITATEEFKYLEVLRARARHDEAQALNNARRKEREKLQVVIDEQAVQIDEQSIVIDELAARIAELEAQLGKK